MRSGTLRPPPFATVLKPYGTALVELARQRDDVVCLGADLTRQTETDLFRDTLPERFFNVGMAEQNLMGIAGGMAREGHTVFVNTFGVFATRQAYNQVAMAIAYPNLPVKLVGFMPGLSSPGGPSHQAIDDVSLMRGLPNMTVVDVADAVEVRQAVPAIADLAGPVYLRLKRGEVPVIFTDDHEFEVGRAQVLREGDDAALIASGMMVPIVLQAADVLEGFGISVTVVNVPTIKPLDAGLIRRVALQSRAVVVAENHSIIGGLGSAVAEALCEAGIGRPLRRVGVADTFAEGAASARYLFDRYGLSVDAVLGAVYEGLGRDAPASVSTDHPARDAYSPV
jgi:transketolase